MGLMKAFSGSEELAVALQKKLEEAGVETIKKENIQSARAGGGGKNLAVEIFFQETDFAKANPVIEEFRMSI
jgi:hypothetical protein